MAFKKSIKNKRNRFQDIVGYTRDLGYDWWLVGTVFVLCIFGLAFLASSLSTRSPEVYQQEFFKQLFLGVGIGGVLTVFFSRLDYHKVLEKSLWILILNYILLGFLAFFALYATVVTLGQYDVDQIRSKASIIRSFQFLPIKPYIANGAVRWIDLPFFPNFQPSEFTKFALLAYFSAFLLKYEGKEVSWIKLKNPVYAFIISAVCIMLQPDMGTVILIFGILAASMWSAQIPVKILVYLGSVVTIIALFLTFTSNYRSNRVTAFLDPDSETATQIRGVQNAIRNGGFFGKGYGNSELKQQPGAIIEQSTDAIIGVIGEEIGFLGTITFLSLYVVLLWRGMRAARYAPDLGGQALATGITVWIVAQAFLNVSGMIGLIPLDGVPLPFVSQGGSAILINLLVIGILLNISQQAQKPKLKVERKFAVN